MDIPARLHVIVNLSLAALLCLSCTFGDSDSGSTTVHGAYVTVAVPASYASSSSRTAIPSCSTYPVQSYVITAVLGTSSVTDTFTGISSSTSKQKMNLEVEGTWSVTVTGYSTSDAESGSESCSGTGTITVSSAPYYDGFVTVTLYPSGSGTGTLSLAVSAPTSVLGAEAVLTGPVTSDSDGTSYSASYTSGSGMTAGTSANTFTISSLTASGATEAADSFASGEYTLVLRLYTDASCTDSSLVYRRTESVAVWAGFTTDLWIDAYSLASGTTGTASYSSTLSITSDDLSSDDTTCTLAMQTSSASSFDTLSSSALRCMMPESDTAALAVTVCAGKTVVLKLQDNSSSTSAVSPSSVATDSSGNYVLTYSLSSPSSLTDNEAYVTVYAKNGIASGTYCIMYGPEYVSSSGSDSNTGSKLYPYATIAQAVSALVSSSDTDNKIVLMSDCTANTSGSADGYTADSSFVSFNYATSGNPLVLTIDGSGSDGTALHAIDAGGTSSNMTRVMYIGSNVTLTLKNVLLEGGYSTAGGGVYMAGGTLNLCSGARIGYTSGTTAATVSSYSNYSSGYGGGMYIAGSGSAVVNMYDGAYISYNYSTNEGAGVRIADTSSGNGDAFNMYGGTLSYNRSAGEAGALSDTYGTFKMLDDKGTVPEAAYNVAAYEGGAFLFRNTSESCMETGSIHGNTAGSNGGGMAIYSSATFTMSGGSIYSNTAGSTSANSKGGGVYIRYDATTEDYFIMSGGSIYNNSFTQSGGKGEGVCNEYSFTMEGSAVVAADNDVYLNYYTSGSYYPYVTVASGYTVPDGYTYGAVLTWYGGNDSTGSKVLAPASGTLSYATCNMFALSATSGETNPSVSGISDLYIVAPDTDGQTTGIITKNGAVLSSISYSPSLYALAGSTEAVSAGSTVTMTVTNTSDSSSTVTSPDSASLTLYQNGSSLASLSGCSATASSGIPTLTVPSWLPEGTYSLSMKATVDGLTYSASDILYVASSGTTVKSADTSDELASSLTSSTSATTVITSDIALTEALTLATSQTLIVPDGMTVTITNSSVNGSALVTSTYNKGLTVGSESGTGKLIIDGGSGGGMTAATATKTSSYPLVYGGDLTFYNVTLQNNYNTSADSDYYGGGMHETTNRSMRWHNCTIKNCYSVQGGAMYIDEANYALYDSTITSCSAEYGGGIYVTKSQSTGRGGTFSVATLTGCTATTQGGGMYINDTTGSYTVSFASGTTGNAISGNMINGSTTATGSGRQVYIGSASSSHIVTIYGTSYTAAAYIDDDISD